jgi:hypothetical protein
MNIVLDHGYIILEKSRENFVYLFSNIVIFKIIRTKILNPDHFDPIIRTKDQM